MHPSLTSSQLLVLRRCRGGLRVWEVGAALIVIVAELNSLRELKFVSFDEQLEYEATPAGEAWLDEFDN